MGEREWQLLVMRAGEGWESTPGQVGGMCQYGHSGAGSSGLVGRAKDTT